MKSVRDLHSFSETMQKYHAAMENLVYAAEILCSKNNCQDCPFALIDDIEHVRYNCALREIRDYIGCGVEQHDTENP